MFSLKIGTKHFGSLKGHVCFDIGGRIQDSDSPLISH